MRRTVLRSALALSLAAVLSPAVHAEAISAATQKVVDEHMKKLTQWATNPAVVAAAKSSNSAGGIAGMSPAKWTELADTDAAVKAIQTSAAGKFVDSLDGKTINKVVVRDKAGNVVAANTKVVLYNVSHRPVFKTAITGAAWQQDAVQKDVTTQIRSVQIAVPIKDGGEIVGVMHASVSAE
jgi:hypothetical protein